MYDNMDVSTACSFGRWTNFKNKCITLNRDTHTNNDQILQNLDKSCQKRQLNTTDSNSNANDPQITTISEFLVTMTKKLYGQVLTDKLHQVAGKFVKSVFSKSCAAQSVLSRKITNNLQNKQFSHIIPTLTATSKKLDLDTPDNYSETEAEIVSQLKQVIDSRLNSTSNIVSSLIRSMFGSLRDRLQLSFSDVHNNLMKLAELTSKTYKKIPPKNTCLTNYLILAVIPVSLIVMLICIHCLKKNLMKKMDAIHGSIVVQCNTTTHGHFEFLLQLSSHIFRCFKLTTHNFSCFSADKSYPPVITPMSP